MNRGQKVGGRWFALFTIAWLVIWMVQLTPVQLLLPLQLDTQESEGQWIGGVVWSGLVLGIGGLAGVAAGPLAGALSDRTQGRRRRRPWALGGIWLAAVCLLLMANAEGPLAVGAGWVGVSVGISVASAAYTAMIADQLPVFQRGAASAAIGSSQAVGIVVGVGAIVLLGLGVFEGYVLLGALIAVIGTATAYSLPDPPAQEIAAGETSANLRALLGERSFAWMLGGRLVVNIGNALGTALLLFFLLHGLGQPSAAAQDNLLLLIVVYTVFVVVASVVTGVVSDRTGRRRRLAVAAAIVQAVSAVTIAVFPTFEVTLIAAGLLGIGYGAFSTVGLAFATDLLPNEQDHARDLGVVNVGAALGQLIGPVLGAVLAALVGGFWLVFAAAGMLSVLGALMTALAREPQRSSPRPTRAQH